MNITLNPKDTNTFTSACLNCTVKMWSIGSPHANFTMDAHDKEWRNIQVRRLFRIISINRLCLSGIRRTYTCHEYRLQPKGHKHICIYLSRSYRQMWSISSPHTNFIMDAHDKGVNYDVFHPGPDRPYLVTTEDDKTIKVWDYLSKSCVQTMEGHTNNP